MAAFAIKAINPGTGPHILGFSSALVVADDEVFEVWNGPTNVSRVFRMNKDGQLQAGADTVGAPAYSWESDKDSGVYRIGANNVGVAVGGSKVVDVSATGLAVVGSISPSGVFVAPVGAVGSPSYTFAGDLDSGFYWIGANHFGLTLNGAKVVDYAVGTVGITGALTTSSTINSQTISATANFTGTLNTVGDFTVATNKFTVTAASGNTVIAGTLSVTGDIATATRIFLDGGSLLAGDTYIYGIGSNTIDVVLGAVTAMRFAPGTMTITGTLGTTGIVTTHGVSVQSGEKMSLNGDPTTGGSNYLTMASLGVVDVYAGGTNTLRLSSTAATVTGTCAVSGDFAVNTSKFTVTAASGNTVVAGTLAVTGSDFLVDSGKKVRVDGSFAGDTYIWESTANVLDLVANGNTALSLTISGITVSGTLAGNGNVTITRATPQLKLVDSGTGQASTRWESNGAAEAAMMGIERAAGGGLFVGSTAYSFVFGSVSARSLHLASNNTIRFTIDSTGIFSFGTTVTTSATASDLVQPNAKNHRWVNAAGTDTITGIGLNASDQILVGVGSNGVAFRTSALATGATTGHLFIPSSAGAPTGVPANIPTGQVALQYDSTNNKLYVYNAAWKSTVALT